jgi:hypothetical protein
MAETNSAWDHFHLRHTFHTSARKQFHLHKVSFSSPSAVIDPIPDTESFQSGGTLTLATNNLVPMALGETHNDPSGLGRWSSITLRVKEDRIFTIITAYRVCKGNIQSSPVGSSFRIEYVHHKQNGHLNPQPRKLFLNAITHTIQHLQTNGHAILLMLDSNGTLTDDDDLKQLLLDCDLSDLHEIAPSPSTYIGSQHRRIDHMLGCPQILSALIASGSLSYVEGPQSDYRGLFVDLETKSLLNQTNDSSPISPSVSRPPKSGNPEDVATYHDAMLTYYADHQMVNRLHALIEAKDSLLTPTLRKLLEKWDADQGRAMKHAKTLLERPKKPYAWSPHFATQDSCADTGAFAFEKNFAQKITPPRSNVSSNRHNNTTQPFSCRFEAYHSPSRKSHNNSRTRNSRCTQLKSRHSNFDIDATQIYSPRTTTTTLRPPSENPKEKRR